MLFLLLADIHAADKPPSSCTDSYGQDILDLLWQSVRIAREQGVKAVIWAGDVFHHKAPSRTSHRLVLELIRVINAYPCPVYIVPGNHDFQYDNVDSIIKTQPLGVLFERGARRLDGWGYDLPLYGVPWQQSWDHESVDDALAGYCAQKKWREGNHLVVTHAPLYPPGRELRWENYPAADFASSMDNLGYCFYGHVHEPHGTYTVRGVTFCNNGAISRGSLHEYNMERVPAVTIWDSRTGEFTAIPLEAKPASAVFRLTEHQEAVDARVKLDEFLDRIKTTTLGVVSLEQVMAVVRSKQLSQELEALAAELLEEAGKTR